MNKNFYDFLFNLRASGFIHHTNEPGKISMVFRKLLTGKALSYSELNNILDGEIGCLSDDINKDIHHLIIGMNFICCQIAAGKNVDSEYSYSLSDYLINKADTLKSFSQFEALFIETCEQWKILLASQRPSYGFIVDRSIEYIDQHLYSAFTIKQVAEYVKVTPEHLTTLFRRKVGMPLYSYIQSRKINESKFMMDNTMQSISAIASALGYSSPSHFSSVFKNATGQSPREYRNTG